MEKRLKVALIGNMNNVFFTLMRYLRDLGLDAHLLMYKNEYPHFLPENDTYHLEKYEPYIHTLPLTNDGKGLILSDKSEIKNILKEYDIYIGCGIAPALFESIGYVLDIFVPYADEIELTTYDKLSDVGLLRYFVRRYTVSQQLKGIKKIKKIVASDIQEKTKKTIKRLNLESQLSRLYIPTVYTGDVGVKDELNSEYVEAMRDKDLVVFSHSRHQWKDIDEEESRKNGDKGLDKLIIGFANFIKENPNSNSLLVLFEYGKDIDASKELIANLGIEDFVMWLPLMPRKRIMNLIEYAHIVVDSLTDDMWSGVGFEGLSAGKILMQNILQTDEEYYQEAGHEIPFILRANTPDDVTKHLNDFMQNRDRYIKEGEKNRDWFNRYAGIGLAKEYKKIIDEIAVEELKV